MPEQNGRYFADDIFKHIALYENYNILIPNSLKFVTMDAIAIKSALVQVMACRLFGDKPLPERMVTQFTDACIQNWDIPIVCSLGTLRVLCFMYARLAGRQAYFLAHYFERCWK